MTIRCARSLAAAQTVPVRGDIDANLEQHLQLACVAASEHVEGLVFPELSLTGYEMELANELAFTEHDPRLGASLHIGAFLVHPNGIVDLYTKQYMGAFSDDARRDGIVPPAEATVFTSGDRNPLVRFGGNVAAVAICADVGRSAHPQAAADRGGGLASAGRSAILSESGELLAQLDASGSGLVVRARPRTAGARKRSRCVRDRSDPRMHGRAGPPAISSASIHVRKPRAWPSRRGNNQRR